MGQTIPENVCPVSQLLALPLTARFTLSAPLVLQSIPPGSLVQDLVPVPPRSTHNPPALPSVAEHLDGINPDEFPNDFTGTVQNNTCNSTQSTCNHASYTRQRIFDGNVTVIHNLTINKL